MKTRAALASFVLASAAFAGAFHQGPFGALRTSRFGEAITSASQIGGAVKPVCTITLPVSDPSAVSGTPAIVSGTSTGVPISATWASSGGGSGSCSVAAGTFSCSVMQAQQAVASETVTTTCTNAVGAEVTPDTTVLNFPTFDLQPGSTGPNDLPTTLVVNGITLDTVLACNAQDASTTWACSPSTTLTLLGSNSNPTLSSNSPFHAFDSTERGVTTTTGNKYYAAGTAAVADITTEDFVVEFVWRYAYDGAGLDYILNKRVAGTGQGWYCENRTSALVSCGLDDVDSAAANASGPAISTGAIIHGYFYVDRDEASTNSANVYLNGIGGSPADLSSEAGTITSTDKLSVGSGLGVANSYMNDALYAFRIFKCPTGNKQCFAGGAGGAAEQLAIAQKHAAIALGAAPTLAVGLTNPTTMTRTSNAFADVVDGSARHVYNVSNAGPRVARRTSAGTATSGYMSEVQTTNLCLQSEVLGTTWTEPAGLDVILANTWTPPDVLSGATGDDLECVGVTACDVRQAVTLTATTYTFSVWARAGQQSVVALRDNTIANGMAFFDLTTCAGGTVGQDVPGAVGTTQAGIIAARAARWPIDSTGDGVVDQESCRISITFTGTVAAHSMDMLCANADNDLVIPLDADGIANCGFWGAEVEAYPTQTSYQSTTTASVTRSGDDLRFDGASHYTGSPSTLDVKTLCPSYDTATTFTLASVGTGTTNYGRLGVNATSDRPDTDGANAGAQWSFAGGSGDVTDGTEHSLRLRMVTNDVEGYYDTASFGTDVSNALPTSASSFLYLGTRGSTAQQDACLIDRVRLWSVSATPTVAP